MSPPFWLVPPTEQPSPWLLHQLGIRAVATDDFERMIAVGWALWDLAGLSENQAFDFLSDGWTGWSSAPGFDPALGEIFLVEAFGRLDAHDPTVPLPIDDQPPEVIRPLMAHYGARDFFGIELALRFPESSRGGQAVRDAVLGALRRTPPFFLSPRGMEVLRGG